MIHSTLVTFHLELREKLVEDARIIQEIQNPYVKQGLEMMVVDSIHNPSISRIPTNSIIYAQSENTIYIMTPDGPFKIVSDAAVSLVPV